MCRYTVSTIKDILNRAGDRSGYAFDKFGPYFVNAGRLKAMKNHFENMVENDDVREVKRIADSSKKSIEKWFSFLADRYAI